MASGSSFVDQFGHNGGDYGSEFEFDEAVERKKRQRDDLANKESRPRAALPSKSLVSDEYSREESKNQRFHFLALDAYGRHKQLVNNYILYYPGAKEKVFKRDTTNDRTDLDVIQENHRFLWEDTDQAEPTWAKTLAKKYWDKLFKEYCIADLSKYKENKIALRWRIEKEVVEGKGHFSCGNKRCDQREGIRSWEVNFAYNEHGQTRNALIKLRLCPECSYKLNYHHKRRDVTRQAKLPKRSTSPSRKRSKHKHKAKRKHQDHKHRHDNAASSSSSGDEEQAETARTKTDASGTSDLSPSRFWSGPAPMVDDKSREEEFAEYLQDIFL